MRIVTVVGARPQFIKAAALTSALRSDFSGQIEELIIHTGQHYDRKMSDVFFEELKIPEPHVRLNTGSSSHGISTGNMLAQIEPVLKNLCPTVVLVYGDTNSTLAGALSAAKLGLPVAHVEAGMRSGNRKMPEEINRVLTDHLSSLNFTPTNNSLNNLVKENLTATAVHVGDISCDLIRLFGQNLKPVTAQPPLGQSLRNSDFALATFHRQENVDSEDNLSSIVRELIKISHSAIGSVVVPMHPRLRNRLIEFGLYEDFMESIDVIDPVPFREMLSLVDLASVVITDSGGLQKEAFLLRTPCVTVREETEWIETIDLGWNRLVHPNSVIADVVLSAIGSVGNFENPFGDGYAANRICSKLVEFGSAL